MPDDLKTAPESPAKWVSTARAAAALGVSERTVLRRAAAGKLESRRETTARGVVVVVALDSADVPTGADTQTMLKTPQNGAEVPTGADGADIGADTRLMAHLSDENRFLRGVIEQLQRDGAETRAALREALKAPRQLTAGTSTPDDEAARMEAHGPRNHDGRGRDGGTQNEPQITPERDDGAVTYASIADELQKTLGANQ
jgi:hypothetical protein